MFVFFFFFKQKTAYEISTRDWSSDVCSSDLGHPWPMVEVVYEEPNFVSEAEPASPIYEVQTVEAVPVEFNLFRGLNWFRSFWLRPGFVAAIVSLILIGILLTFRVDN